MRRIFAAIRAAFSAMAKSFRWVLKATATGLQKVLEAIPSFGGGGGMPVPEVVEDASAAAAAKADELAAQVDAHKDENRAQATAIRKVARAMAEGQEPDEESANMLAPCHLRYLQGLRKDELERLVEPTIAARRACMQLGIGVDPQGFPTQDEVISRKPADPQSDALRSRVEAIRARKSGQAKLTGQDAKDAAQGFQGGHWASARLRRRA